LKAVPMRFGTKSGPENTSQSSGSDAVAAIDALYSLEMKANFLALRQQRRAERVQRSMAQWSAYWPVAVGIMVSFFAPQMRAFVEPYRPWGLWVSFPMVALAARPEVYMGSKMAALFPTLMLYLQFPLEGLLAKFALRGNVTAYGVIVQVLYFHVLCVLELWLVNGGVWQLLHNLGH
jgi:hypothetical protein